MKAPLLIALALFGLPGCLLAAGADVIIAKEPYVRAVPPGMANTAAFMRLENGDKSDHVLVGAESPVAKVVELHTHIHEGGMMMMRKVDKIALPAGKGVDLQPGGLHIMLLGLVKELQPGETVEVTLVYEDGSKSKVSATVRSLQGMMMPQGPMQH